MSDTSMNSEQQELAQIFWNANRLLNRMSDYEIKTTKDDFFIGMEYSALQTIKTRTVARIKAIDKATGSTSASTLTEVKGV